MPASGGASLFGLELGDCAETSPDAHADGACMTPAVSREQFSVTRDLSAEAEIAVIAEETGVRLAADLVGAAEEVGGGGAPGTSVEGAELIAAEAGCAACCWRTWWNGVAI